MARIFISFLIFLLPLLSSAQIITTIAGTGRWGFSGDGGPATAATVGTTSQITIDKWGNIYFTNAGYSGSLRKIDTAGIITTVAGDGSYRCGRDSIAATASSFQRLRGVGISKNGTIYVCDEYCHKVRKIDTAGNIHHVAGTGARGFSGDGGVAATAQVHNPYAIVVDDYGNCLFADKPNYRIRKIDTNSIIQTIAGNGWGADTGNGGPATVAALSGITGLFKDTYKNIYIVGASVRKIDTIGIITKVAGRDSSGYGYSGDGGPATAAQLNYPTDGAMDVAGNMYITDQYNHCVRKIDAAGIITTFAGVGGRTLSGSGSYSGDGGPATAAYLNLPTGIAVDDIGNVIIGDMGNFRIRKVTVNNASAFTTATSYYYLCPGSGDVPIDSLLGVTDIDTGQVLTWAVQSPPIHGTAVVSYSDTNTGGVQYPMGTTYAGDTTLTLAGIDSFTVSIRDQLTSRIITKKIIIHLLPGGAGSIAGADSLCLGDTSRMAGVTAGGTWGTASGGAVVTVSTTGLVTAVASGYDTVYYAFTNTCVTDTAFHALRVDYPGCTLGVANTTNTRTFTIIPNPTNGTFNLQLPTNEPATITIKDLLGKTIHQTTTQQITNTIYLYNTPAGIYLLTIRTAAGVQCGRLVVE